MDSDVSPALLEAIQTAFDAGYSDDEFIAGLLEKVQAGTATYEETNLFAESVGDLLADCYKQCLSSEVLPDGKMYYNIAEKVVEPTLTNNYELVSGYSEQVQAVLNQNAGIGIKAQKAELNYDRIEGIINKISAAEQYDDVAWVLDEPVKTFTQSIVDDTIKKNAEFQYKSGLNPTIKRKLAGGCCEWCAEVAGTYSYPDVPKDVYRRHQRCRCTVEYDPKDGKKKVQDVHTKEWRDVGESDIIAKNKLYEKNKYIREELKLAQKAEISYPGRKIDVNSLGFDDEHINKENSRGIEMNDAESWIENSVFSINVWNGTFERYFSDEGAVYVDLKTMQIRTAYRREEFTENITRVLEKIKDE